MAGGEAEGTRWVFDQPGIADLVVHRGEPMLELEVHVAECLDLSQEQLHAHLAGDVAVVARGARVVAHAWPVAKPNGPRIAAAPELTA